MRALISVSLLFGWLAFGFSVDVDEADFKFVKANTALNGTYTTNTYAQAINYGKTNPKRDGGSWNGCGAFHWWDIGSAGHVAMATDNGWSMMASCHVTESWGDCIGVTSVSGYTATTGAKYLGWSYDYNGAEIADVHKPIPPSPGVPRTATQETGSPDVNYYKRQQIYASHHGYTGPIDGVLGKNSWAGTQRGLRDYGYTGPDDGVPGENTYKAMQRLASHYGYTGPVDGALGPNSYRGLATYFNTL